MSNEFKPDGWKQWSAEQRERWDLAQAEIANIQKQIREIARQRREAANSSRGRSSGMKHER